MRKTILTRASATRESGMTKAEMKEAIWSQLVIGKKYQLISKSDDELMDMVLEDLSTHVAVFRKKNGTKETFTYQELWIQMMKGEEECS